MKNVLKLKGIVLIVLIGITINLFEGCTSINEKVLLNSTINTNEISNKPKDDNKLINLFKLGKDKSKAITINYDDVKDSLIRFHVIANSDSEEDQNLKIKVKNEVIDYLYPYLNKSQSIDESRKILKDNMEEVKKIAERVIKNNNYKYNVDVELSRENFPEKSYGNVTLPQGNYEAFRIIIGNAEGKNWWCVMFPPLCFVDESKAQVEYEKTQNKIYIKQKTDGKEANLKNKSLETIDNNQNCKDNQSNEDNPSSENYKSNIKIKFKIVEEVKKLFK